MVSLILPVWCNVFVIVHISFLFNFYVFFSPCSLEWLALPSSVSSSTASPSPPSWRWARIQRSSLTYGWPLRPRPSSSTWWSSSSWMRYTAWWLPGWQNWVRSYHCLVAKLPLLVNFPSFGCPSSPLCPPTWHEFLIEPLQEHWRKHSLSVSHHRDFFKRHFNKWESLWICREGRKHVLSSRELDIDFPVLLWFLKSDHMQSGSP